MIEHGHILVASDFSAPSDEALRQALVLARTFGAKVHLLHVIEPVLIYDPDFISLTPVPEINETAHQNAQRRLEDLARSHEEPIAIHLEESMASVASTVCDFAEQNGIDLIVIGRHGHQTPLERLFLGSTAERIVRHAPCSVLVSMPHGLLADGRRQSAPPSS